MVAGEWVSDYSKRPGRSSIPRLGLKRVKEWSSRRHSETKNGADARKQEEMGAKERPGTQRSRGTHYEVFSNASRKGRVSECRGNKECVK
ncbi:tRNA (guanine-N(7)-)-methyltransferase non-catalytic subunit TRM82 [Dissostichus eleginoides]|uniref:tRNA (Guanine-N(7)-)-methyltransferase non-catalytic subunit TRM82 n=1 Tax=Dissostichus eleginoides TaxID=100907 RepID=A0AAD9FHP5_DISEL|nr:tRNA (guanine-N(7)-)-methyltransferase non-catalytic subunit TRM82 [Dissostichus eleginoides]